MFSNISMMRKTMKKLFFLFFLIYPLSSSALVQDVYVDDDWEVLTNGTDPDLSGPAQQMGLDAFSAITPAIAAVEENGIIHVAEGSYPEQVVITRNLTLQGAGSNTIIESPALLEDMFFTGVPNKPIVFVQNASHVHIRDLTVDGLSEGHSHYRFMGIAFLNASGTIDHTEIRFIENTPRDGTQHGIGIYIRTTIDHDQEQNIVITNNHIDHYQKNGMAIVGDHLVATITDNTVIGSGPTDLIAQNGIQLSYGATGTIARNTVTENYCTSIPGHCTDDPTSFTADSAAGILIFAPGNDPIDIHDNILTNNQNNISALSSSDYFSSATQLLMNIFGNTIDGGQLGIALYDVDGSLPVIGNIFQNIITDQEYGLFVSDYTPEDTPPHISAHLNQIMTNTLYGAWSNTPVDARYNWWGCSTGSLSTPRTEENLCDRHADLVDVSDHLLTSDISGSGGATQSNTGGNSSSGGTSEAVENTGGSSNSHNSLGSGGVTENSAGGNNSPAGEEGGISGHTDSGGTSGFGGSGGGTGTLAGTENNFNGSGCSCHITPSK